MTDQKTTPTPAKKRGRPPRVATTPQDSPVAESKPVVRPAVPAEPEIDTQRPEVLMARHMIQDHRMTWGEVRISLGYRNDDVGWAELYASVLGK